MMEDLDAAGVAEEDTTGKAKRRLEAGRRLVFGNARARVAVLLAVADLLACVTYVLGSPRDGLLRRGDVARVERR